VEIWTASVLATGVLAYAVLAGVTLVAVIAASLAGVFSVVGLSTKRGS
jgi:hypothetical protein